MVRFCRRRSLLYSKSGSIKPLGLFVLPIHFRECDSDLFYDLSESCEIFPDVSTLESIHSGYSGILLRNHRFYRDKPLPVIRVDLVSGPYSIIHIDFG